MLLSLALIMSAGLFAGWICRKTRIPALIGMILAGASVDDVFVIVMFTAFTGLAQGEKLSAWQFVEIPLSVASGIAAGAAAGYLLTIIFEKFAVRDTAKLMIILSAAFGLTAVEDKLPFLPFASLIAVMSLGTAIKPRFPGLSSGFDKLWIPSEVMLFVLVGASIAVSSLTEAGASAVVLILAVLLFRMTGVLLCLHRTNLNFRERLFCMLAYTPKATVQAAIGGIPLAMGLSCGNTVLTVSVIAILITAPLGAFAIDLSYKKLLKNL